MLHDFIVSLYGETTYRVIAFVFKLYSLWLPPLIIYAFWQTWVRYVRYLFFSTTPVTVLEVRLPKEILKSPAAMELVMHAFYQTGGESTPIAKYWEGKTRAWFSLEIVSLGGQVGFYIWTRNNMRNIIEAQIYSHYPEVEVREVEDYAKAVEFNPVVNDIFATNWNKEKDDVFPMKTYVDYGLDKDPKEEFKINPLITILEQFGAIKPQENLWLQFVIRAHKKEKRLGLFDVKSDYTDKLLAYREAFRTALNGRNTPSQSEARMLEGLERSVLKHAFDVGIRVIYVADKSVFNSGTVTMLRNLFRPFSAGFSDPEKFPSFGGFNSMNRPNYENHTTPDTDYPWQDYKNIRMNHRKRIQLDAYKRRMFFYQPYHWKTSVFTTEELATMYHFPGASAATPGLPRIESKRATAPTNLPV
jgi:hypothetical protein